MKLTESNPYLRDPKTRLESTLTSVLSSSAIEGIHVSVSEDICRDKDKGDERVSCPEGEHQPLAAPQPEEGGDIVGERGAGKSYAKAEHGFKEFLVHAGLPPRYLSDVDFSNDVFGDSRQDSLSARTAGLLLNKLLEREGSGLYPVYLKGGNVSDACSSGRDAAVFFAQEAEAGALFFYADTMQVLFVEYLAHSSVVKLVVNDSSVRLTPFAHGRAVIKEWRDVLAVDVDPAADTYPVNGRVSDDHKPRTLLVHAENLLFSGKFSHGLPVPEEGACLGPALHYVAAAPVSGSEAQGSPYQRPRPRVVDSVTHEGKESDGAYDGEHVKESGRAPFYKSLERLCGHIALAAIALKGQALSPCLKCFAFLRHVLGNVPAHAHKVCFRWSHFRLKCSASLIVGKALAYKVLKGQFFHGNSITHRAEVAG